MTLVKVRTGTGKTTSDWGVLDLFQDADGLILALKNFCSGVDSQLDILINNIRQTVVM